jgi:UDP-N-acetylmuramoyl-L-alanyl-D-glutamate--2,6-diaminopimelate ligase
VEQNRIVPCLYEKGNCILSRTLAHHLKALPADSILRFSGGLNTKVKAPFVEDSRQVQRGGVFVARRGLNSDGHAYIEQAIERGAAAIVGEQAIDVSVPYIQVRDAQVAVGYLAASYHDFPSRKLTVFGVTGTNGKTTTIHLLHSILNKATKGNAGFISTIGAEFGKSSADTGLHVTTPSAPDIQKYMAQMVDAGLTHVVLEMTSHGLAQERLAGIDIDVAILTNLTHEHLDYHGSFEAYRAAKGKMFAMLAEAERKPDVPKIAIVNRDDPSHEFFSSFPADEVITYSLTQEEATFSPTSIEYLPDRIRLVVDGLKLETQLVGDFNLHNILAAVSAARTLGIHGRDIRNGVLLVKGVSGRMERIDEGQDFTALVDFAHTPDALEKALQAGRSILPKGKRLIAVFGSAGLRDIEKRYMMASVSEKLADITILTAEDPRTESLDRILLEMADGCITEGGSEGETFFRVPDRGQAIYEACQMAQPGDLVMVCGKGHEQSMCFGTTEYPWDDRDALRTALRGDPLLTLPTAEGVGS